MAEVTVLNKQGQEAEKLNVSDDILNDNINTAVLHQAVVMYQAWLRQGNASTKERAFVSGGGAKPYRQKGTGRARVGSSRNPLWTGGGTVFGPHPRDFDYTLPKKIKKIALRESLKSKYVSNNLICVEDLSEPMNKTKEFVQVIKDLGIKGKTIAILDGSDESIVKVTRNIPYFQLMRAQDINAYDILRHKNILTTRTGLNKLIERINKINVSSAKVQEETLKDDRSEGEKLE